MDYCMRRMAGFVCLLLFFVAGTGLTVIAAPADAKSAMTETEVESYAIGYLMGDDIISSVGKETFFDSQAFLSGVSDAVAGKPRLSQEELVAAVNKLNERIDETLKKEKTERIAKGDAYQAEFAKQSGVKKTETGLLYKIEKPGKKPFPTDKSTVTIQYVGTLIDGTEFDRSVKPVEFPLGGVVPGFNEGLKLIGEGGKIRLVIPPQLAYGDRDIATIPAQSTLVFDIELQKVQD